MDAAGPRNPSLPGDPGPPDGGDGPDPAEWRFPDLHPDHGPAAGRHGQGPEPGARDREPRGEHEPAYGERAPEPPPPRPEGFGLRTGVRSHAVAVGIAVFLLVIATLLLLMGAYLAAQAGDWWAVAVLAVLEAGFIGAFLALRGQARGR